METRAPEAKAPEAKATEISAKVDLLKVSKDILEHLGEVGRDVAANVIPAQGQAMLADLARTAAERMATLVRELEAMPEELFLMIPAEGSLVAKEKETSHAQGHQSRQGVRGH
jgi:hypothetical protein